MSVVGGLAMRRMGSSTWHLLHLVPLCYVASMLKLEPAGMGLLLILALLLVAIGTVFLLGVLGL